MGGFLIGVEISGYNIVGSNTICINRPFTVSKFGEEPLQII
jgi:hypothetical protein